MNLVSRALEFPQNGKTPYHTDGKRRYRLHAKESLLAEQCVACGLPWSSKNEFPFQELGNIAT